MEIRKAKRRDWGEQGKTLLVARVAQDPSHALQNLEEETTRSPDAISSTKLVSVSVYSVFFILCNFVLCNSVFILIVIKDSI